MKKGFTLIELLAVLVILALIIVIVLPEILDSVTEARQSALESSARGIYKSLETEIVKSKMGLTTLIELSGDYYEGTEFNDGYAYECPYQHWNINDASCAYYYYLSDDEAQKGYSLEIIIYNLNGKYKNAFPIYLYEGQVCLDEECTNSNVELYSEELNLSASCEDLQSWLPNFDCTLHNFGE